MCFFWGGAWNKIEFEFQITLFVEPQLQSSDSTPPKAGQNRNIRQRGNLRNVAKVNHFLGQN